MVDIHSHILWEIDDGAKTKEMSLEMLRQAISGGSKKIVATPHFIRGHYEIDINELEKKVDDLRVLAEKNRIDIGIYLGKEVCYTEKILDYYDYGFITTINHSRYMLIEFRNRDFSIEEILDNLYELQIRGIAPVIAHPERYLSFIKKPELINKFIQAGYLFQLNANSLLGYFNKDVKNTAIKFLKNDIYSFIGSDAHRDENRNANMQEALKNLEELKRGYGKILETNGEKLLNNEEISFIGTEIKAKRKGIFSVFSKR